MLSVASLLNPVKVTPEPPREPPRGSTRLPSSSPSSSSSSPCTSTSTRRRPLLPSQSCVKKTKMNKDGAVFAKGKVRGQVRFAPFERLDEEVLREVQKFHVYPLGNIQDYSRHIPYNSEKKTFLEKTGRESFEVFQYVFRLPGDEKEYVVMWDYNIGLVRITPFFKCCRYSKTTPAKMLNMNPGLKEITHSITGGALAAQGYWMPYACARAVCTTFCSHIAAALIPIFGPSFPSLCVPAAAPEHGRMIIDSQVIVQAKAEAEAEAFRLSYSSPSRVPSAPSSRDSDSPVHVSDARRSPFHAHAASQASTPHPHAGLGRRLRLKRALGGGESPYSLPTDTDVDTPSEDSGSGDGYFLSPVSPSPLLLQPPLQPPLQPAGGSRTSWLTQTPSPIQHRSRPQESTAHRAASSSAHLSPHPLLSAIPRSAGLDMTLSWRAVGGKRRAEDADDADDGEDDNHASLVAASGRAEGGAGGGAAVEELGGAERKAAWLLLNLSVQDGEGGGSPDCGPGEGPRIKRRRATSM
ncbi:hypothetical protein B2J93_7861 [Marssonina coronariae]|uniref:HTH APSES-type domain-containing protein n=1 Tax=Diplocarpon coronariae TaxID=2795749 RepID=A0A218ZBV6_9HELO|nr:hypothetical protein B2J93_7861 [Marssonina coronariae]